MLTPILSASMQLLRVITLGRSGLLSRRTFVGGAYNTSSSSSEHPKSANADSEVLMRLGLAVAKLGSSKHNYQFRHRLVFTPIIKTLDRDYKIFLIKNMLAFN